MRISVALFVLILACLTSVLPPESATAGTCQIVGEPDPKARLDSNLDYASLVLVGQVREENPSDESPGAYASVIDVAAVLKGDLPANPMVLDYLSDIWLCVGGPRLREGTAVMLLLYEGAVGTRNGIPIPNWQTGPAGGNVVFGTDGAVLDDYEQCAFVEGSLRCDDRTRSYLGNNEDVIRQVARKVNASDADTARAIAAVSRAISPGPDTSPAPQDSSVREDDGLGWPVAVASIIAVLALITLGIAYMRARTFQGTG